MSNDSLEKKNFDFFVDIDSDQWDHNHVCYILNATLEAPDAGDSSKMAKRMREYSLLTNLKEEIATENNNLRITERYWDRALLEKIGICEANAFSVLVQCFDRSVTQINKLHDTVNQAAQSKDTRTSAIQTLAAERERKLRRLNGLITSYAGLSLSPVYGEMFWLHPEALHESFSIFAEHYFDEKLSAEFVDAFKTRFSADESEILEHVVKAMAVKVRNSALKTSLTIPGSYNRSIELLSKLVQDKALNALLVREQDFFVPSFATAPTLEVVSCIGPFLGRFGLFLRADDHLKDAVESFPSLDVYSMQPSVGKEADGIGIGQRNLENVRSTQAGFRASCSYIYGNVFDAVMALVRTGESGKSAVANWLYRVAELNKSRMKLHFDKKQTGSDTFLWSTAVVALKLCLPFANRSYTKLHIIDAELPLRAPERLALIEDGTTRLCMPSTEAVQKVYKEYGGLRGTTNFATDMFWSGMQLFHVGPCSIMRFYTDFTGELRKKLQHASTMMQQFAGGQFPNAVVANQFKSWQKQLDGMIALKIAMETHLFDDDLLLQWFQLVHFECVVLLKALLAAFSLDSSDVSYEQVARGYFPENSPVTDLPIGDVDDVAVPGLWAVLPEWLLENVIELYLFVCRYRPLLFERCPRDEFMTLAMVVLLNPKLVKNFYLKSKLVEIIFHFSLPLYQTAQGMSYGSLDEIFRSHPLARAHLVPCLLRFYVDAEQTGLSSQFYDKFNIRFHISKIIQCVWNDQSHRMQVVEQSRASKHFIRFVNLLMTDTTYLLDESLSKLADIHSMQVEMASAEYGSKPEQYKQEKAKQLELTERQADGYMSLGNETVHMLNYMTAEAQILDAFVASEIVERLAAMLDYNLRTLVGPKSTELRVKNPEKYRFNPKRLLTEITGIYLHLAGREEFIQSVAKDSRSYGKDIFDKATQILRRANLRSPDDITLLHEFVERVEACIRDAQQQEEDLGDVPDEFLDPLMYTIMSDPVILPSSGTRVDRSTIVTHLLSDAHDPFNRVPLKLDEIIPDNDLKLKIEQWKHEKLAK